MKFIAEELSSHYGCVINPSGYNISDEEKKSLNSLHLLLKKQYGHQSYHEVRIHYNISSFFESTVFLKDFLTSMTYFQILLNILYENRSLVEFELGEFLNSIIKYTIDNPNIGFYVKKYKTKSPLLLPSISLASNKLIAQTLDILELKNYKNTILEYEEGMKQFMCGKSKSDWKNVIEDMHNACDEIIKDLTGNDGLGFQYVFKKSIFEQFGLNGTSKEIFKSLKIRIDDIKHGSNKYYAREDAELIINLSTVFIQHVAKNYKSNSN